MSNIFNPFDALGRDFSKQVTEREIESAIELSHQGKVEEAIRSLDRHDPSQIPKDRREACARCYIDAGKHAVAAEHWSQARSHFAKAGTLGFHSWLLARRLELLKKVMYPPSGYFPETLLLQHVCTFLRPPKTKVRCTFLDECFSATVYRWQGDDNASDKFSLLIRGLKSHHDKDSCKVLGAVLAYVLRERAPKLLTAGVIIPVPADPARMAARGFDNILELGRGLEASTAIPLAEEVVVKCKTTADLRSVGRSERRRLLVGCFAVSTDRAHLVQGESVLLVDDVVTSGATLDTCSEALKAAGAVRVVACTVAHSESTIQSSRAR